MNPLLSILLFMTAVLPSKIDDDDALLSRYFLPYQMAWIKDDAQMRIAEKSVRVGFTWADAFKNVRKRLHHPKRDYLFATKDQASAIEYVQTCEQFLKAYNLTKTILERGIEAIKVPIFREGKDTGFAEEVKLAYIKFDNGSRILAFSSNPNAMRVFGGDVGLDEFAFHPAAEQLWATAQGRITWGYDIGVWSSHNGNDTLFYVFIQEARAGRGGWRYHRVTIDDAIAQGLVEKINQVSGKSMTREAFLKDCQNRARLPEIFEEVYRCNPQGSTAAIVPWASIERCMIDAPLERLHLEEQQIFSVFGEYNAATETARAKRIQNFLDQHFDKLFSTPGRHALGYDVAASGEGDLGSIYVDRKMPAWSQLHGLLTCRTQDWHFHKTVLWHFMRRVAALSAAGDETGLGRQICWETAQQFPGQFLPVNFASDKHDMGFALMNRLAVQEKRWPRSEMDVGADYFTLRKTFSGKKWHFSEGTNNYNPHSHCDIAWSGALADKALQEGFGPVRYQSATEARREYAAHGLRLGSWKGGVL